MSEQTLELRTTLADSDENNALLDIIFSAILVGGISKEEANGNPEVLKILKSKVNVYKQAKSHFKSTFQDNIFFNEYDIFYQIFMQYENAYYSVDELKRILEQNKSVILKSKYIYNYLAIKANVRQDKSVLSDDEFFDLIVIPHVTERYLNMSHQLVELEEYLSACERYIEVYKRKYLLETAENMTAIVQGDDGARLKIGKSVKELRTTEDCMNYYLDRIRIIHKMEAERGVQSLLYNGAYLLEEANKKKAEAILDYGVAELDAVKHPMRRGNMVCIMGPPKGGKTTFTTYLVERALDKGLNVAVWPLEGTVDEWVSLLTSSVLACGHVRGESGEKGESREIDKASIMYEQYENPDDLKHVTSAKYTLAAGENRGALSFLTGVAYVEDFEDELTSHYENINRFDVLVVDSPINMQTRSKMGKTEYLSKGFMGLKNYVSNKMKKPALCLVTAQYKQDVIDMMRKNPNTEIDVTSGGETAESIRTPDDVIGLFSNATERDNRMMKVYDIASRGNGHYEPFYMGCSLGCGNFWSDPSLN